MGNQESFQVFANTSALLAGIMTVLGKFYSFPYGRTYIRGKSVLKVEVPDRIAFILVHSSGLIIFMILFWKCKYTNMLSFPAIIYIIHYAHRVGVYPFSRSLKSKPWPLESVLYYSLVNCITGYTIAFMIIFDYKALALFVKILLTVLVGLSAFCAAVHDYQLSFLRAAGDSGYRIPSGLCFKWVSCPNYEFEMLQWIFYACYFHLGTPVISFVLWQFANLSARSKSSHEAYQKIFLSKYPEKRTAMIPFLYEPRF